MSKSYWQAFTRSRLTRRRALAGAASVGLGAAALTLLACGGGDGGGDKQPVDKSGLLYTPKDSTSGAKAGGTLKHYVAADVLHFDAVADPSGSTVSLASEPFYSRLLRFKAVKFPEEPDGSSQGEVAESWEISPDKLQITMKIRPGMKWDSRTPTSGRILDASDIVFSWNKFKSVNAGAAALVYNASTSPEAPIESVTATDERTILVKLHQPNASIIPLLSARDLLYVGPKESDGGFDPKTTVRGHGPFVLEEYVPSARFVWKKNPDYYLKDRPFIDRVEVPIVSDQAQRVAQFRAGNIHTDVLAASQNEVVTMKRQLPEVLMLQDGNFPASPSPVLTFGWEQASQFRDLRLRQALSMMIDRDAYIDVIDNRDAFRKEGIELPVVANSVIPAGWGDYALNPADTKEFGPNARYLTLDLAEAKKLLSAAGQPNGFEFDFNFAPGQYGAVYERQVQLLAGFFSNAGLKPKQAGITPASLWLDQYSRGYRSKEYAAGSKKGFTGIALVPERTYATAAVQVYNQFHKDGQGYRGMVPAGGSVVEGDPKSNELALKIGQEFDRNKQVALVHDLIRYVTGQTYYVPRISAARSFTLWWPAIGNLGAYVSYPGANTWSDLRANWWIDESKAPLKKG
jgi:peptide/nickel transport system substrate-binding protein